MAEPSPNSITQRAVNFTSTSDTGNASITSSTNQKGKFNTNIAQGQDIHIGDVYNYYASGEADIPQDVEQTKPKVFPYSQMHITEQLPEQIAVLYVYENGKDYYSIWGGNVSQGLRPTSANERPKLSLGQLVLEDYLPEDIRDDMSDFSELNLELRKWLKALRKRFAEHLCLVIADYTDYEIPWEMVELSPTASPNEYVGALITTVRWQDVISEKDTYLKLEFIEETLSGSAVAYVNQDLEGVGPELEILQKLKAVTYHNISQFQAQLQQDKQGYGFFYIACHGIFTKDMREMALGSLYDKNQQLKLRKLRRKQLKLLRNSGGIVFINACHSGQAQAHPSIPHRYRWGFVELFLKKGAKGVIGTLGPVGDSYAAKFASELINAAQQYPTSVAALIRRLRARVLENLPEDPTTEDLLPLIYAFMYVYYGNPLTILHIARGLD